MMKRQIVYLVCTVLVTGIAAPCAADLAILNIAGEKVVHDNTNDIVWIHDLGLFSNKNFDEVLSTIEGLNNDSFFGQQDWHVATRSEIDFLWSYGPDAIETYFLPAGQWNDQWIWQGRYEEVGGNSGRHALMATHSTGRTYGPGFGSYGASAEYPHLSTWVAAVPEPATILLLGLGAVAMRGRARKK